MLYNTSEPTADDASDRYETHRQINAEIVALRRAVEQLQLEHLRIMRRIAALPSETGELKV